MTKKETYEKKTEDYLLPLMEEYHFELVDVEYVKEAGNWYLRAYIDKEGELRLMTVRLSAEGWENGWTRRILSRTAIFWK